MNKLFTRIGVAMVGLAMAVGVGVAVGNNTEVKKVEASTSISVNCTTMGISGTGYSSKSNVTIGSDGFKFSSTDVSQQGGSGDTLQFKKSSGGTLWNSVCGDGKIIDSISLTSVSGGSLTVYAGSTVKPTSGSVTGKNSVYSINNSYFTVKNESGSAGYCQITVTYSNTSGEDPVDEDGITYVKASEFNPDKNDYYLSANGTEFAYRSVTDKKLDFGTSDSSFAKIAFEATATAGRYYLSFTTGSTVKYLNNASGKTDVSLVDSGSKSAEWAAVKDGNNGYMIVNRSNSDRYLGLTGAEDSTAKAYASSSSHETYPPVYLYETKGYHSVLEFANEFNERLGTTGTGNDGICKTDGSTNLSDLATAWNGETVGEVKSLTTIFTDLRTALGDDDKNEFDEIIKETESNSSGDSIQKALSLYDHLVINRGLSDFLNTISGRDAPSMALKETSFIGYSDDNSATLIIILVSSISLVTAAGYFVIRRRKEQ